MQTAVTAPAATQDLVLQWRDLVATKVRIYNALEQTLGKKHDLSCHEFEVLDQLAEHQVDGKGLRVQELADVVPITQSALSRLVGRLEEQGLVARALCSLDRRGIYVELTDGGRARHAEAKPTYCGVLATEFAK